MSCQDSDVTAVLQSANYQQGVNVNEHAGRTSKTRHSLQIGDLDHSNI